MKKAKGISREYRPVSLVSVPRKVMEKMLLESISKHMKVIGISQHGFTKGKSCLSNLIAAYSEMASLMDKGRAVDVFYLNFSVNPFTLSPMSS